MWRDWKDGIGGVIGMLLIVLAAPCCLGAETTPAGHLDHQQQAKLNQLQEQLIAAVPDGSFSKAVEAAREIAALRERWQGKQHWQTVDARLEVKRWEALARLPEKEKKEVGASFRTEAEADALTSQRKYALAQPLYEKALTLRRKILGEQHPETAASCNSLADNLYILGKYPQAQVLQEKALAIRRKVLGEEHPDTAQSYNNLAVNLNAQGKYPQAQAFNEKALDIRRKVLGEEHRATAQSYNNLAETLHERGKVVQAQAMFEKALAIRRKVLGEDHPDTAESYNDLAFNLIEQHGKPAAVHHLYEKALAIRRKVLGDEHPDTAQSYNNLAFNLAAMGKYTQARPLYEKGLSLRRKVLGDENPETAQSYNNLGFLLDQMGLYAEARPMYEKALAIRRKLLGDEHQITASTYNNLAIHLNAQGLYAEAHPLYEKAWLILRRTLGDSDPRTILSYNNVAYNLALIGRRAEAQFHYERVLSLCRQARGENHPLTARGYNNLGMMFDAQGKYSQAQPLLEKALAIRLKTLGEENPDTAQSYGNLAGVLASQGQHARAQALSEKALLLYRKLHGEYHPATADSYLSVAFRLREQGKYREARLMFEKSLTINRKILGEEHPDTALTYFCMADLVRVQGNHAKAQLLYDRALSIYRKSLGVEHPQTVRCCTTAAGSLWEQGKVAAAVHLLQDIVSGWEAARYHSALSGFDRARALGKDLSARAVLAVGLARLGQPIAAFDHAEASLSRGLLDDLIQTTTDETRTLDAQRVLLDEKLLTLYGTGPLSPEQKELRQQLVRKRQEILARLTRLAAAVSARQLLPRETIQKQLPVDAALVLWMDLDTLGEHHVCIVRSTGAPIWIKLPGSDKDGKWSKSDLTLADRLYKLLRQPNPRDAERQRLTAALAQQRFEPLRRHLGARDKLPAVKQLLVVPTGWVARVPLEVLGIGYRISYVPSGSVYARLRQKHRAVDGSSLLALGDPVFTTPTQNQPKPPASGVLVTFVQPQGGADRAGLQSGDVLVQLGKQRLQSVDDLKKALAHGGRLGYWRQGIEKEVQIPAGPLGIRIDLRPTPQAVRDWQEAEASPVRGGPAPAALPGTRWEVKSIARLVPGSKTLLGSDASEQQLHELARTGKLKEYRLLHLATHGIIHEERPEWSALLLARDHLPDPLDQVRQGKPVFTGELRVDAIRRWQLDADLVALSACKTALGQDVQGDGRLGFAHAFLQSGAHAVLLSRWSADDTATALLMLRFYENLLGKSSGLKKPLPRAEALAEASEWLRQLRRSDALVLASRLGGGKLTHTTRGTEEEWTVKGSADKLPVPTGDRPYAHPAYWAAFVLVGDAD